VHEAAEGGVVDVVIQVIGVMPLLRLHAAVIHDFMSGHDSGVWNRMNGMTRMTAR
jgi:hypothetical protein